LTLEGLTISIAYLSKPDQLLLISLLTEKEAMKPPHLIDELTPELHHPI
jgi:hypothetical protein